MVSIPDAVAPARQRLQPVVSQSRLRGLGNLFANELRRWWGTRRWLVHLFLWVGLLNGLVLLIGLAERSEAPGQVPLFESLISAFLQVGAFASAIGIVTVAQSTIIGEKQLGTAAWIMSKPASRSAYLLAKLFAYGLTFVGLAILLPAAIFAGESLLLAGRLPAPAAFLAAVGVLVVHTLFYLGLTLMLGTFFSGRGPVVGLGVGIAVSAFLAPSLLPQAVLLATPWPLGEIAPGLALGSELPAVWPIPLLVTALWAAIFVGVALWRFGREEF